MMKSVLIAAVSAVQAYLLGSIDTGILVSKFLYHDDVRKYGSGAAGMTNMLRTFGKKAAALTAFGDVLKGVLAVCIGRWLFTLMPESTTLSPYLAVYLAAIFAIIGHLKPLYFGFKGGKGVLVAGGTILAIQPVLIPFLAVIFLACLLPTGMVSLGSVTMAALYPVLTILYGVFRGYSAADLTVCTIGSVIMAAMVIYMHRSNIQRIREGKEYRFGRHGKKYQKIVTPPAAAVHRPLRGGFCICLFLCLGLFLRLCFGMPPTEPVGGDAALGGGKIRRRMTVRQVCAKGRDKEELAHNEDQRNRANAEQVLHGGIVSHHQMAGNGVQQHLKAAAGAVLGQHLDELNADHNVQAALQKGADLCLVAIEQQAGHPADQGHNAEQQTNQHQPG